MQFVYSSHACALTLALTLSIPLVACDKSKNSDKSDAPKTADTPKEETKPEGEASDTKKASLKIGFKGLRSEEVRANMEVPERAHRPKQDWLAELDKENGVEGVRRGAPLPFTRLDAGRGFFCGTLKNGPVRCWGQRDDFLAGGFIDIAVGSNDVCAVSTQGGVSCLDQTAPSLTDVKRISASGNHFCALQKSGTVRCWATAGEALVPPPGLKARYLAVGLSFACAANEQRELECWGSTSHLNLPEHLPIKDLASTDLGMCVLTEDQQVRCFGKEIDMGSGKFTAINGGFATICGKKDGVDETVCKGGNEQVYSKPSQRVAVTPRTLCALTPDGTPDCQGPSFGPEISIPRAAAPEPSKTEAPHFKEFLALFPEAKMPFDMTRKAQFEIGQQLEEKFYNFLDSHPSKYRVVAKVMKPTPTVIVLDWDFGYLQLFTYDELGNLVRYRTVASLGGGFGGDEMLLADGTATETFSVASTESTLSADGHLATTKYNRQEVSHYGTKKKDGKRPLSHIECVIGGAESVDQLQPDGTFKRLEAKVLPSHAETDKDGCGKMWPNLFP